MKPTIGRIVIYNDGARDFPAIVTRVHSDTCVNLAVFDDSTPTTHYLTSVLHESTAPTTIPATTPVNIWRWPSRD
jgi:hypothetical protein